MLTKRDFERIADDLRIEANNWRGTEAGEIDGDLAATWLVNFVADLCAKSNPNFDRAKFLARVNRE